MSTFNQVVHRKQILASKAFDCNRSFGVVTVTGSDAGYCASVGLESNCDENFILTARKYKDGTATGTFIDVINNGGKTFLKKADIDCIKFFDDTNAAVISGKYIT